MRPSKPIIALGVFLTAAARLAASPIPWPPPDPRGGEYLVVDHQPHPAGGSASDTAFRDMYGREWTQRTADDFQLDAPARVTRILFWGFYGHGFESTAPDPPESETMRIRFYDARPGDGLPGAVLFEELTVDPARINTGNVVLLGNAPPEYLYEVLLEQSFDALADAPYWLEIAQIENIDSYFRWEYSLGDSNGRAYMNQITVDWQRPPTSTADLAYQIWVIPEPMTLLLAGVGICVLTRRTTVAGTTGGVMKRH